VAHAASERRHEVHPHPLDDFKVSAYYEAAILIGCLTQEATYRGNPFNAQLHTTPVFIYQHEQWHLAGAHFCNIGQLHLSRDPKLCSTKVLLYPSMSDGQGGGKPQPNVTETRSCLAC